MQDTIEIKQQMKEALQEYFNEDKSGLFRETILEVIEDIALGKAMEKADIGDFVEEEKILEMLDLDK